MFPIRSKLFVMYDALPGGDLIEKGLDDLRAGRETFEALLVAIGASRLRSTGIDVPDLPEHNHEYPEHALYNVLAKEDSDSAHSRYDVLIRRLVSYERAAECARTAAEATTAAN